jgi:hypothetical protein
MAEIFILSVPFKDELRNFEAELRVYGYTHKIAVMVEGVEIIYEPDEERNYRAFIPENFPDSQRFKSLAIGKMPDPDLLEAIAHQLETDLR